VVVHVYYVSIIEPPQIVIWWRIISHLIIIVMVGGLKLQVFILMQCFLSASFSAQRQMISEKHGM